MEVILLERVEKLGQMGDVVAVKPGYARNFLLPRKKALRATEANRAAFEQRRVQLEADNLKRRDEAEAMAARMESLAVVIVRQASDNDHLYGSVTTRDVAGAVADAGFAVDRRQVRLGRPVKTTGMHPVRISLHPEVLVDVTVNVARTEEEAAMQARGERLNEDGEIVGTGEDDAEVIENGPAPPPDDPGQAEQPWLPGEPAPAAGKPESP